MQQSRPLLLLIFLNALLIIPLTASDNLLIVIIDGARYSETFGDPGHAYIPNMAGLAENGTVIDYFYNDSMTWTARAIPALWCGTWTDVQPVNHNGVNTSYAVSPTIFEYYRKGLNRPAEDCFYAIKELSSLWLASFDPGYGPAYWPTYHSKGQTDADVAAEAEYVMNTYHPSFLLVYLADVDSRGHSGDWAAYIQAIQRADSIVGLLWQKVQSDPFYKDQTTMFVTNDHGRHDDQHGGFSGHGDGCDGCRRIQFLAIGPHIKTGYISTEPGRIPDMTATAGVMFGFETPQATGQMLSDIFVPALTEEPEIQLLDFQLYANYPNPFNPQTTIRFAIARNANTRLVILDITGREIVTLHSGYLVAGEYHMRWNGKDQSGTPVSSGIYFSVLSSANQTVSRRLVLMR